MMTMMYGRGEQWDKWYRMQINMWKIMQRNPFQCLALLDDSPIEFSIYSRFFQP